LSIRESCNTALPQPQNVLHVAALPTLGNVVCSVLTRCRLQHSPPPPPPPLSLLSFLATPQSAECIYLCLKRLHVRQGWRGGERDWHCFMANRANVGDLHSASFSSCQMAEACTPKWHPLDS